MGKYDEIINLPHHVSKTHPQMPMLKRAAQFLPFAALRGYGDAIKEIQRQTEEKVELEESDLNALNEKMQYLRANLARMPEVTFTYFKPDERKAGGAYLTISGMVKRIDEYRRMIILHDGTRLPMDDIKTIDGEIFAEIE